MFQSLYASYMWWVYVAEFASLQLAMSDITSDLAGGSVLFREFDDYASKTLADKNTSLLMPPEVRVSFYIFLDVKGNAIFLYFFDGMYALLALEPHNDVWSTMKRFCTTYDNVNLMTSLF